MTREQNMLTPLPPKEERIRKGAKVLVDWDHPKWGWKGEATFLRYVRDDLYGDPGILYVEVTYKGDCCGFPASAVKPKPKE